jgi:hypothetical protein
MIEVYSLPSCIPRQVKYYSYTNSTKNPVQILDNVVVYEMDGILETGILGVKKMCQISTSILPNKPSTKDYLEIDGLNYKFNNPVLRDQSIAFVPFWESEIKGGL